VSDYQYQKLIEMSKINGVKCGVLIQFREFNEVWYINISKMEEMRLEGKKTIKIDEARNIGLKLDGTIKKVNWKYNLEKFFQEVL
jgi:penicillin-binding protein-related factor A (putative recombinase)